MYNLTYTDPTDGSNIMTTLEDGDVAVYNLGDMAWGNWGPLLLDGSD